ncbi:MAG: XAC2610-related protein, partial [Bacteroidota bacterium]
RKAIAHTQTVVCHFIGTMKIIWTNLIIWTVLSLSSCGQRNDTGYIQDQPRLHADTLMINCDSVFSEVGYYIQLITFDSLLNNQGNSILVFGQRNQGGQEQIYLDTLYSKVGQVEFRDFNQDDIKDVLVQNESDARSNWTYNLFLTDLKGRTLTMVQGFDQVKNPSLNSDLQIIESHVNSGTNYIEFYKLVNRDSIFKYDILVYDSMDDISERNYKLALDKIRSK